MTTQRKFILHLSSFILVTFLAVAAVALDIPPTPNRWFTDRAGIVSATEADLLNRKLEQFEQSSGAQFIVYIFPALEDEALEDFTHRVVEQWKVGQKKYDNGIVLFVFVKEQKVRIEVGYGLEGTITDAFSSRVIRDVIAPAFQAKEFGKGLQGAADAIINKIRTGEEPVPPIERRGGSQGGADIGVIPLIIILFVVFFVIAPMFSRRRSGCGGCILPFLFSGNGISFGSGGGGGFGGGSFGGGGGFSGGGGSFGGGGASGGW